MSEESDPLEVALTRYRERSVSIGRAAELADVSVRRFIDILGERGVEVNCDESDLRADFRAVQTDDDLAD